MVDMTAKATGRAVVSPFLCETHEQHEGVVGLAVELKDRRLISHICRTSHPSRQLRIAFIGRDAGDLAH